MARCEIQWIDKVGKPTPDQNDAVTIAVSTITYPDGTARVRKFPCCSTHAKELNGLIGRGKMVTEDRETGRLVYVSQWTEEPIRDETPAA